MAVAADRPDEQLVADALNGDPAAFEVLLGRHLHRLHQVAVFVVGRSEADQGADQTADRGAAQIVHDVCVAAWRRLPDLEPGAEFGPWLDRLAVPFLVGADPDRQARWCWHAREVDRFTYEQIATLAGLDVAVVRSRIHIARRRLAAGWTASPDSPAPKLNGSARPAPHHL